MPAQNLVQQIRQAVQTLSLHEKIRCVALYGSHAKGTAHAQSDLDLVVEFAGPVGYFEIVQTERELEELLHVPVDLVTPEGLSPYLREAIFREAIAVYGT